MIKKYLIEKYGENFLKFKHKFNFIKMIIFYIRVEKISKNKNKIKNLDEAVSDQVKQDFKALLLRDLDKYLIKKYPVKLNKKVFDRVKKYLMQYQSKKILKI